VWLPVADVDSIPLFSTVLQKEWSRTFAPAACIHVVDGSNFTVSINSGMWDSFLN
jgi:hypothetical protein